MGSGVQDGDSIILLMIRMLPNKILARAKSAFTSFQVFSLVST